MPKRLPLTEDDEVEEEAFDQDLIDMLMAKLEQQQEILRQAKNAKSTITELNRMIARLGGEVEEKPRRRRSSLKSYYVPVVAPNEDGTYSCPECDYVAKNPQGLGSHRYAKHSVKSEKPRA
jgi:hypothetical protein